MSSTKFKNKNLFNLCKRMERGAKEIVTSDKDTAYVLLAGEVNDGSVTVSRLYAGNATAIAVMVRDLMNDDAIAEAVRRLTSREIKTNLS